MTSDPIGLQGGLNTYGYVGSNVLHLLDRLGLKYTPENCALLATWIGEQWQMFWVYFDRSMTGEITTKTKAITHTVSGCSIYPDEGRRLACEAHEKMHSWYPQRTALAIYQIQHWGGNKAFIKRQSQYEMFATEVGIKKGEQLYKENCIECNND